MNAATTPTLPQAEELTATQALIEVMEYEEAHDTFSCMVSTCNPHDDVSRYQMNFPACLLPAMIGECGEPDELVGRTFLVEHK